MPSGQTLTWVAGRGEGTKGFYTLLENLTLDPQEPLKNFKAEAEEGVSQF